MGTTLSIINNTDSTWDCRLGPDKAALSILTTIAAAIGAAATAISTCTETASQGLRRHGYVTIRPGERHDWNDLPASLWQQCHCTRTTYDLVNRQLVTEHIFMRPIFSASLAGQTAEHEIGWWMGKEGHYEVRRVDV